MEQYQEHRNEEERVAEILNEEIKPKNLYQALSEQYFNVFYTRRMVTGKQSKEEEMF